MHPTVKPVALIADAILDASRPKEIVLDPFAGSGSTLVAAEKTRRTGFGIELDPIYCDVIVHRLAELMKVEAVHAATGMTWKKIAQQRSMEVAA
jgi:DNA modification methylase